MIVRRYYGLRTSPKVKFVTLKVQEPAPLTGLRKKASSHSG